MCLQFITKPSGEECVLSWQLISARVSSPNFKKIFSTILVIIAHKILFLFFRKKRQKVFLFLKAYQMILIRGKVLALVVK